MDRKEVRKISEENGVENTGCDFQAHMQACVLMQSYYDNILCWMQ